MSLSIVILAAGQGKRMCSQIPKVLHLLAHKPLLTHVVDTAHSLNPRATFVVYGHGGEQVRQQLAQLPVQWIQQDQQLGTGHATLQALPHIHENDRVLILVGDIPLVSRTTLEKLLAQTSVDQVGLVTVSMPNPAGFGRVLRNSQNAVVGIVEDKDATAAQRAINEINTGIIVAPAQRLQHWLTTLTNHNAQQEYYLPDIIARAVAEGLTVTTVSAESPEEVQGVNDRVQLASLERYYQRRFAQEIMLAGVTLRDPARFDVRGELQVAQDVTIDVNVLIAGKVIIGAGCTIGPNCVLRDVVLGANVAVQANSVIEGAVIADDCIIGPFARIRPETELATGVHIGNFVEVKKSRVARNSKINHLSYVGDAVVGQRVNVGAGTITCNYDGVNKHQTIIEDDVHIGSNTQLVAPVTIGMGATIGAGSTITRDAPAGALTLCRTEQRTINGWQRKQKQK